MSNKHMVLAIIVIAILAVTTIVTVGQMNNKSNLYVAMLTDYNTKQSTVLGTGTYNKTTMEFNSTLSGKYAIKIMSIDEFNQEIINARNEAVKQQRIDSTKKFLEEKSKDKE